MASKYVDTVAIVQVIGSVFIKPQLLEETDKYIITEEDFTTDFHRVVYEKDKTQLLIKIVCNYSLKLSSETQYLLYLLLYPYLGFPTWLLL